MSIIPYVIEQTSRGERSYDIFSRLLSDRIIFLGEEVTDASASTIRGTRPGQGYSALYQQSRRLGHGRLCDLRYNAIYKV